MEEEIKDGFEDEHEQEIWGIFADEVSNNVIEPTSLKRLKKGCIKKKFSTDEKYRLIALIKSSPQLWDSTNDCYTNQFITRKAWQKISLEMNSPEDTCKSVWKSIKSCRNYHLKKKIRPTKPSGAPNDFSGEEDNDGDESEDWEFGSSLEFLKSPSAKTKTKNFPTQDEESVSSLGSGNYFFAGNSSNGSRKTKEKKETNENKEDLYIDLLTKIQNRWDEKDKRKKEQSAVHPDLSQFKHKEVIMLLGRTMEELSSDVVLSLTIKFLSLIESAKANQEK